MPGSAEHEEVLFRSSSMPVEEDRRERLELPSVIPNTNTIILRLRERLRMAGGAPERDVPAGLRRAAVLVAIVMDDEPSVLLTLRAAGLSSHAGQVALPGGRLEPGETAEAAALREAAEEVGLDPRLPEVIGRLPGRATGTGFHITPVVATLTPPFLLTPSPDEVAEIFRYPLRPLLDPSLPGRRDDIIRGWTSWVWPHEQHLVWGATAEILRQLALVLRD